MWTYDRWFWRSAAGCHCGDETFNLKLWVKCDIKLQLATSTWNFNLQLHVKFWFRNSTSNLNLNLRLRSLIWNFNLKSWLEASIWKFNLQFQFEFLALDLRLDISSEHFSVRTKFVRTCEIEKIIIRAEIVRTKFVRTHVVYNLVQKRSQIEEHCPSQGTYLLMWMRIQISTRIFDFNVSLELLIGNQNACRTLD